MMTGGFIHPFSEFARPRDQLTKRLGYQEDSGPATKEAKSLLAAAGQSNMQSLDFMVRALNHHKLFAQAIQRCSRRWTFKPTCGRRSNFGSATRRPAQYVCQEPLWKPQR
jgi:hypothetical protein